MKKLIILIIVIAAVGGLWYWGTTRASLLEDEGKLAVVRPGRVEVPISASGEARERQRVDVKAEASGNIIAIPVEEGDIVQPGDLLVHIDEEEEQRNVDKAQAALDQAEESLAIAELAHEQAIEDNVFNVDQAQASLEIAEARFDFATVEYEAYKGLLEKESANPREYSRAMSEFYTAKAQHAKAKFDLKRAKDSGPRQVRRTAREIEATRARKRSAEYTLQDAQRRLRKTKVVNNYSISPCRVVRILVSEGQVVSSAVSVVGAGTPIMELADISAMEVEAQVDESDIHQVVRMMQEGRGQRLDEVTTSAPAGGVRNADEVEVRFDALPRQEYQGRIVEIAEKPRNLAQIITYAVRIRLQDHPDIESIRLGMQSTVEFQPASEEGLCVPHEAVKKISRDQYVVKQPDPNDERADPVQHEVEVGLTDGKNVIIRSGLDEGAKVYTKEPTRIRRNKK
ncbi:MAG: biotin/lipoyl-binding protein [bacterium]|nr:biotin/lipoyl-binding protein [bacterium]